jgi:tetratricopeptide (TPR) repeat protein
MCRSSVVLALSVPLGLLSVCGASLTARIPVGSVAAAFPQSPTATSRATQLVQGVDKDLRVLDKAQLTSDERQQLDRARSEIQSARRLLQNAKSENEMDALSLATSASKAVAALLRRQLGLDELISAAERYRAGDPRTAVDALSGSLASDLDGPVRYIEDNRDRLGVEATPLADLTDKTLVALCLLETDVAFQGRYDSGARLAFMRRLLSVTDAGRLPPRFVERWYVAVAGHLQGSLQLVEAGLHVEDAVRLFPDDPEILIVAAMFYELVASPGLDWIMRSVRSGATEDPRGVGRYAPPPPEDERASRLADVRRTGLTRAEQLYRRAAAAETEPAEAHLRLGRILFLASRPDAALSELRLAAAGREPRVHYLASMFEGAVHEGAGRLDAAIASYEEAVRTCPTCLTGGIALSHAQRQNHAPEVARRTLDLALANALSVDYWWGYPVGALSQRDPLMRELRGSLR